MTTKTRSSSQSQHYDLTPGAMEELILKVCKQQSDYIVRQLDDRLNKMENSLKEHLSRVAENSKKIDKVCLQVNDVERRCKQNNLIVYGIEEGENETSVESEDKLILLFKNKLSIDVAPNEIGRCHRIGKVKPGTCRPILVQFIAYKMKSLLYNKKKLLKKTPYVIKEDLTSENIRLMKSAIGRFGLTNVWSLDGNIYAVKNGRKFTVTGTEDFIDAVDDSRIAVRFS
nr:unnamed protein product [Callosobruchus analis]